jgi:prepilin-type N-terminal cleavage/methylation domain-containing protein
MEHHFLIHRNKGFTLLELLISISIIGILIAAGVASYSTAQKKSRDSRRMSDLKAIQGGFEQYNADFNGNYPVGCALATKYLPAGFPTDPKTSTSYASGGTCNATSYCICAALESTTGNATAATCPPSYGSGQFFCVANLQ